MELVSDAVFDHPVMVPVPANMQVPGADSMLVPGVIIGLTFSMLPSCVDPLPAGVSLSADGKTRAERAQYNAEHPPESPRPAPMTIRESLAAITGVGRSSIQVNDLGDVATAADDRCTRTSYVRNTDRWWLLSLPFRTETVAVACGQTPVFPDHAIGDIRVSYDGQAAGVAPTVGDITRTEVAESRPVSGPVYVTVGTASYDLHGRVTTATDAAGNTTRSGMSPPSPTPRPINPPTPNASATTICGD